MYKTYKIGRTKGMEEKESRKNHHAFIFGREAYLDLYVGEGPIKYPYFNL
jgi:hypothetical protein